MKVNILKSFNLAVFLPLPGVLMKTPLRKGNDSNIIWQNVLNIEALAFLNHVPCSNMTGLIVQL